MNTEVDLWVHHSWQGASRVRSCCSKSEQLLASDAHIDTNFLGLHDDMRPVCFMN